jgi:hypothetical protein
MSARTKERLAQDRSAHRDEHPCLEWFRWFVENCLRLEGGASNRDVLLAMRGILDMALKSCRRKRRKAPKPRRRSRKN